MKDIKRRLSAIEARMAVAVNGADVLRRLDRLESARGEFETMLREARGLMPRELEGWKFAAAIAELVRRAEACRCGPIAPGAMHLPSCPTNNRSRP